ncbi:sigma-70 family RNA polymerase sigma factor [Desulforamulus aquiferis]|nr:sigma-70 family RNA polymerase sigma factor [Desulforamulus aquiferis]
MEEKFKVIYQKNYYKLVRQAAFLLGDSVIAEDQVQEAFVRLHRTGIENVEHPVAWLAVVTNNLCYDYMRSEGSRRRREERVFQPDGEPRQMPAAEELVLDREEVRLVRSALEKLQPRDRIILLMKFSGYSYDEIAVTAEIGKNSVGTILSRARERFKREYEYLMK